MPEHPPGQPNDESLGRGETIMGAAFEKVFKDTGKTAADIVVSKPAAESELPPRSLGAAAVGENTGEDTQPPERRSPPKRVKWKGKSPAKIAAPTEVAAGVSEPISSFDADKLMKDWGTTYFGLAREGIRKRGIEPADVPEWKAAADANQSIQKMAKQYAKESDPKKKAELAQKMNEIAGTFVDKTYFEIEAAVERKVQERTAKGGTETPPIVSPTVPETITESPAQEASPSAPAATENAPTEVIGLPAVTETAAEESQEVPPLVVDADFRIVSESEATPKEWREKLRTLIAGAKEHLGSGSRAESLRENLAGRSEELDREAEARGSGVVTFIRSVGEKYNKLGWKSKLGVGLALGVGTAAFSGVSLPAAIAFGSGIAIQRVAGMSGMFVKFERFLQNKEVGTSPRQRALLAGVMAVGYTGLMGATIGGAVHLASESSMGEAVHGWLGNMLGHHQAPPTGNGPEAQAPAGTPEAPQPAAAAAAGEAAMAPTGTPEVSIDVQASPGHGYEFMVKRVWDQLQEKHLDPSKFAEGSDIRRLLEADAQSIDKVVHQIAADPSHGFFNADGTSVRIGLDSHMTIAPDGSIHLGEAVHAPIHAPVTPAYHPEAPTTVAQPLPPIEETQIVEPAPAVHEAVEAPTPETAPSNENFLHDSQGGIVHTADGSPVHVGSPEASGTPEMPAGTNSFGLSISATESHIYADQGAKHLFVFGGTPIERSGAILEYLTKNPNSVVFSADDTNSYRVPWYLAEGKLTPGVPVRTPGLFGFFSSWMKPPGPDEFAKVIK